MDDSVRRPSTGSHVRPRPTTDRYSNTETSHEYSAHSNYRINRPRSLYNTYSIHYSESYSHCVTCSWTLSLCLEVSASLSRRSPGEDWQSDHYVTVTERTIRLLTVRAHRQLRGSHRLVQRDHPEQQQKSASHDHHNRWRGGIDDHYVAREGYLMDCLGVPPTDTAIRRPAMNILNIITIE